MQHLTTRQTELKNQEYEVVYLLAAIEKQALANHRQNIHYAAKGISTSSDAVSLIARSFAAKPAACAAIARITEEDNYLLDSTVKTVGEREEKQRKTAWEHNEF